MAHNLCTTRRRQEHEECQKTTQVFTLHGDVVVANKHAVTEKGIGTCLGCRCRHEGDALWICVDGGWIAICQLRRQGDVQLENTQEDTYRQ